MYRSSIFSQKHLYRAISICDYILEDDGHTVSEAAKEFKTSRESIRRDIQIVADASCIEKKILNTNVSAQELRIKIKLVEETLKRLAKQNRFKKNLES